MDQALRGLIARNLRSCRTRRGLRQSTLAEAIHVSQQTLSNIERGAREPTLPEIFGICEATDSDLLDVLRGIDPELVRRVGVGRDAATRKSASPAALDPDT